MNKSLLQQIKKRRTQLGLKQVDMQSRTGISRQQYQKLESQGNPRLETLEIIAAGLNAQLMLIPDDKVHLIRQLLNDEIKITIEDQDDLMTNPWKGLLWDEVRWGEVRWGEALDITRQAIVKLGTQEADLSVKEVDEIIGSICDVASRFNKITQEILPEQIRSETLQMIQSRIEHNIHLLNWI